jgi:hypothetical protein
MVQVRHEYQTAWQNKAVRRALERVDTATNVIKIGLNSVQWMKPEKTG